MKVEITGKTKNDLMKRQELAFKVSDVKATPSRKELRAKLAAETNSKEGLIVVDRLETRFGSTEAKGRARIYNDRGQMEKMEVKPVIERNFGRAEKKRPQKEEAGTKETPDAKQVEKPLQAREKEKQAGGESWQAENQEPEKKAGEGKG